MTTRALHNWLIDLKQQVDNTNHFYSRNLVQGWPIPFFGDVLRARVLTVGVNPSDKEFNAERQWDVVTNPKQWQARMLNYFYILGVPPCPWFETWSMCLGILNLSYAGREAAHIDVSPRSTKPMLSQHTHKPEFRAMVENDVKWLFELVDNLPQVQLLLVAGPIPRANGQKQQLADFIREQAGTHGAQWSGEEPLPRLITTAHPEGIPVFVCPFEPGVDGLYAMVRQVYRNRDLLRSLSAPRMRGVPIMPARLDWPSTIGNFLLNFGTLEYLTFVFLKDHLSEEEFPKVRKSHLKDRTDKIAQYLKEGNYPPEQQAAFAALCVRLDPLRDLRNHIAHGHMLVRFEGDPLKPVVTLFQAKDVGMGELPDATHLEYDELLKALSTLTELIEAFQDLAGFKAEGA